jgi:hypothetical protein
MSQQTEAGHIGGGFELEAQPAQLDRLVSRICFPEGVKDGLLIGSYREHRISLPHGRHNISHPAYNAHFHLILQAKIIQTGLAEY